MGVTTSTTAKARPKTSGAYLAASAAYNAGFRGWALVVMTAIAGRESSWHPTSLNNNPATSDYSVGLWQINYYGDLLKGRTAEYGSPSSLLSNPQDQANAAYKLVGGNSLAGLSNWALAASPASGVTPSPTVSGYTIAPYMPEAASAAAEVGQFGPAPASQIAQVDAWPGTSPLGSALSSGGDTSGAATAAAIISAATTGTGCSDKGSVFKTPGIFGVGSATFTYCELKALVGGLTLAAGGVVIVIGMASLIVGSLGGRSAGAKSIAPTILVAQAAGKVAGAPRRRSRSRASSTPTPEPSSEPKPAPRKREEFTPAQQATFDKVKEQKRAKAA